MKKPLTPEERRWISRLKRVMADQPDGLWLFAENYEFTVLRLDDDRQPVMDGTGCVDQGFVLDTVACGHVDGGDW